MVEVTYFPELSQKGRMFQLQSSKFTIISHKSWVLTKNSNIQLPQRCNQKLFEKNKLFLCILRLKIYCLVWKVASFKSKHFSKPFTSAFLAKE